MNILFYAYDNNIDNSKFYKSEPLNELNSLYRTTNSSKFTESV